MSEFLYKFVALIILALLVIGAVTIISGDMTLADAFFSLFRYHG